MTNKSLGRMTHRLLAVGVCVTLFAATTPVVAGDFVDTSPEVQWGGFYVGGQLGGAWSETDWHYENHNWFNTLGTTQVISNFDIDGSGIMGGGQLGFNYQTDAWVLGIEGSVAGPGSTAASEAPSSRRATATPWWLAGSPR